jgi:hypothetical protein
LTGERRSRRGHRPSPRIAGAGVSVTSGVQEIKIRAISKAAYRAAQPAEKQPCRGYLMPPWAPAIAVTKI